MAAVNERIRRSVRVALAERDMTQRDLAEKLGIAPQHVSDLIRGKTGKIPASWQKMLEALDLELVAVPKARADE